MFMRNLTTAAVFAILATTSVSHGQVKKVMAPPPASAFTEIFCEFRTNGTSLSCSFQTLSRGKDKIPMSDRDVSTFIDKAAVEAFVTVKSRGNFERTFLVDPKFPTFAKIEDLRKNGSTSELSRAKSDLFQEIEKRLIEVSNTLDGETKKLVLVKSDPDVCTRRNKMVFQNMSGELDELRQTCAISATPGKKAERTCYSTEDAKALLEDNKNLITYMTDLLSVMQDPKSCLGDKHVRAEADGSVDMAQVKDVAKAFGERCMASSKPAAVACPVCPAGATISASTCESFSSAAVKSAEAAWMAKSTAVKSSSPSKADTDAIVAKTKSESEAAHASMIAKMKAENEAAVAKAKADAVAEYEANAAKAAKAAKASASATPVVGAGGMDYFSLLLANNKGKQDFDSVKGECNKKYRTGPFLVAAAAQASVPLCVGTVACGDAVVPVACEASTSGKLVYCPSPAACAKNGGHVVAFGNGVRVAD